LSSIFSKLKINSEKLKIIIQNSHSVDRTARSDLDYRIHQS